MADNKIRKNLNTDNETELPVEPLPHRSIDDKVRLQLFVSSGGRCQFAGCNEYLLEHQLTQTPGNFAQAAHIVAFKEAGPRGDSPQRPEDINGIENLMLLCPPCHDPPPIKESISGVSPGRLWTILRSFVNGTEAVYGGADYRFSAAG